MPLQNHNYFQNVTVLQPAEAVGMAERVESLRKDWSQRNDTGLYHTIGVVTEEDARDGEEAYCEKAEVSNKILNEHFSDLLESVRKSIEELKETPTRLHDRYGLPGIMIYLAPSQPAIVVGAQPHYDRQFRLLEWGDGFEPVSKNLLSFTLTLALPRDGAGLRTWPQFRDGFPPGTRLSSRNADFLSYEVGAMLCHDGLTPHHGVGMRTDGSGNDRRITLQGFGVRIRGEWVLYW